MMGMECGMEGKILATKCEHKVNLLSTRAFSSWLSCLVLRATGRRAHFIVHQPLQHEFLRSQHSGRTMCWLFTCNARVKRSLPSRIKEPSLQPPAPEAFAKAMVVRADGSHSAGLWPWNHSKHSKRKPWLGYTVIYCDGCRLMIEGDEEAIFQKWETSQNKNKKQELLTAKQL